MAEEIRLFKSNGQELTPVEQMIIDAEGVNHVPPIALQNQLMARGRTLSESIGGTGLGLSSASAMAIFNGGYLTVGRNNVSRGAIMSVSFPIPRTNIDGESEKAHRIEDFNRMAERVMAMSEGYAMVRRQSAMPFVCNVKDLTTIENRGGVDERKD